ncbi:surfeit locus protein 4 [Elysia marginata]|uniref:Surfeit locus protein 4 n=1 Tax=Elysia marginata TaxID=1093978 RepID=A0AAV4HVH8_9GAST|nr:surfeit locus protein 4 [Elysia marginata]
MVSLKNNTLHTDLYSKPTDTLYYLHWSSCHPFHTKSSIPYSIAFRLIRICSCEVTLTRRLTELTEHLKRRGFPLKHIQKAILKAKETPRSTAIQRRRLPETQKKTEFHLSSHTTQHYPTFLLSLKNTSPFSTHHRDVEERYPTSPWQPSVDQKISGTHLSIPTYKKHTYVAADRVTFVAV